MHRKESTIIPLSTQSIELGENIIGWKKIRVHRARVEYFYPPWSSHIKEDCLIYSYLIS